jgi:hypothetical protein
MTSKYDYFVKDSEALSIMTLRTTLNISIHCHNSFIIVLSVVMLTMKCSIVILTIACIVLIPNIS